MLNIRALGHLIGALSFFLPFVGEVSAADPKDPAALLFDEFSSRCASQGSLSQRVLSETKSLQRILESIKNDEACQEILPLINSIMPLAQQLPYLNRGILYDEERESMENYMETLSLALSLSSDEREQATLSSEIASIKFRLVQRTYVQETEDRLLRARAVVAMTEYADQLSKFADNSLCFERNKTLPFQLAGHLMTLAGAFFSPVVNVALIVGGRLFQSFFRYIAEASIVREIKRYRDSTMWMGLSCAMEALEDTVCDLQDQEDLLKVHRENLSTEAIPPAWEGFDIMTRDYFVVKDFLQKVKAGAGAASGDAGANIAELKEREARYLGVKDRVDGYLRDAERKYGLATTDDDRRTIVKNFIITVRELSRTFGSAVAEGDSNRIYLWIRIGNAYPALDQDQSLSELIQSLDTPTSIYKDDDAVERKDLRLVYHRFEEVQSRAMQQLEIEKALTLGSDPQRTMTAFSQVEGSRPSPEVILKRLVAYLQRLRLEWMDHGEYFPTVLAHTSALYYLGTTLEVLSNALNTLTDPNLADAEKLLKVYEILRLRDDDLFITNRLTDHVDTDVDIRVRRGLLKEKENYRTVLRISSAKLVSALAPSGLHADLARDLERADVLARMNLNNFSLTFGESIVTSLSMLTDTWNQAGQIAGDAIQRNYAQICALSLNFPKIPDEIKKKCEGQVYGYDENGVIEFKWDGNPLTVSFDEMSKKPFKQRACAYKRFMDQRRLLEIFRRRPSPFLMDYRVNYTDGSYRTYQAYKYD